MTATTHTVREQGVMVMECDIPDGMTIAEYKAQRSGKSSRLGKARAGLRSGKRITRTTGR